MVVIRGALKYTIINVIGITSSQIVLWFMLKKYISFQLVSLRDILFHIKPNIVLFIPVIAISLYNLMDKVMLATMTNYHEVGFFETSEKIIQIPLSIVTAIGTVMLPKMSNLVSEGYHGLSEGYIKKSVNITVLVISAMAFGIMAVSKEFMPLFYGKGFSTNIILFQILLPSCIFMAVANIVRTQYLMPYKLDRIYIQSTIIGALVNITINFLLIPKYSSIGASIGTLVAEASVCIYQIICIRKEIAILNYIYETYKYILYGFIIYLIIYKLPILGDLRLSLIIKIILGIILYLPLGILFLVKKKEINNEIYE